MLKTHTIVESLETDLTPIIGRIASIESDYVTSDQLVVATAATAASAGFLTAASNWYTSASGTTRTIGGFFDDFVEAEESTPDFNVNNLVQQPTDWLAYPSDPEGFLEIAISKYMPRGR